MVIFAEYGNFGTNKFSIIIVIYLKCIRYKRHYIENTVDDYEGIEYITHKELNKVKKKNKSLFIAAYSLTECSLEVRTEVEPYPCHV